MQRPWYCSRLRMRVRPTVVLLELLRGDLEPGPGLLVVDVVLFSIVVIGVHNTGPPRPHSRRSVWRSGEPVWVPAAKWTQKSTRSGRTMSPLQIASSCSHRWLLFSCPTASVANAPLCALEATPLRGGAVYGLAQGRKPSGFWTLYPMSLPNRHLR